MTSYHQYRSPQELHLLSILAQSASRQVSGCLRITDGSQFWLLFLEQGKLVFASDSTAPFDRLDRSLKRIGNQTKTLLSPVRVQVRLLFEQPIEENKISFDDYDAICWLVQQQYLTEEQAGELIRGLAQEVLEILLPLKNGSYSLLEDSLTADHPRFCKLDLRTLVESCQVKRLRRSPAPPNGSVTSVAGNTVAKQTTSPVRIQPQPQPVTRESTPPPVNHRKPINPTRPIEAPRNGYAAPRTQEAPSSKTFTVACIDDSPTVLSAIESFLDDRAFKVLRIPDPVSALMQIIRHKPDLILLDVAMPNLDGYELCSLLRRHPSFKQTPIIMVTGNRGFIDRAKAKLVGASGYLTKPFTQPDLLKIVFKHLS